MLNLWAVSPMMPWLNSEATKSFGPEDWEKWGKTGYGMYGMMLGHAPWFMMGWGNGWMWLLGALWLLTWVLVLLVLVALLRWLWKKGEK